MARHLINSTHAEYLAHAEQDGHDAEVHCGVCWVCSDELQRRRDRLRREQKKQGLKGAQRWMTDEEWNRKCGKEV